MTRLKQIVLSTLVLIGIALCFGWVVLQSKFFSDLRSDFVGSLLSQRLGYNLVVNGDAVVTPGVTSKFTVTDVSIPSSDIESLNLAELSRLSLKTNTYDLLFGKPDFRGMNVTGFKLNLVTTEDGHRSWFQRTTDKDGYSDPAKNTKAAEMGSTAAELTDDAFEIKKLVNFFAVRSELFTEVDISIDNAISGFSFDFKLAEMNFKHDVKAQRFRMASHGTVNGLNFNLATENTLEGPFLTQVTFGDLALEFEGVERPRSEGGGFEGKLDFKSGDLRDLFAVLRLDADHTGLLTLSAEIEENTGTTQVKTFSSALELPAGQKLEATGKIADLKGLDGVDIQLTGLFYPEGNPPPRAKKLSDLRVTKANARLRGDRRALVIENAVFQTNAFEETIPEFGPFNIGSLRRTSEGKLEIEDINIQAGPRDAPFIRAQGEISDALVAEDFEFLGQIRLPIKFLLANLSPDSAAQFGILQGEFDFNDNKGYPRISAFRLKTAETKLWSMQANALSGSDGDPLDLELDIKSEIPNTGAFFDGLGLKGTDVSPIKFDLETELEASGLTAGIKAMVARSDLKTSFALGAKGATPFLKGNVESDTLRLVDLQKLIAIGIELSRSNLLRRSETSPSQYSREAVIKIKTQPLVLPEKELTLQALLAEDGVQPLLLPENELTLEVLLAEDGMQPLVLPKIELTLEDLLANEGMQPLVLSPPAFADLLTVENMLQKADVDVGINVKRLSGVKGVSSIASELVASSGKARLGPINVSYGGGFATAQVQMDLINAPDWVTFSGSTGGWNFGRILNSVGAGIDAEGILNGNFNLTGRRASLHQFVNSMQGTVRVNMSNGSIATSLLELAGLGVLPWLFSKERMERRTKISCLNAPLRFNAGRVSFDQVVAETRRVQVVAKGSLDWRNDLISIHADPRRIGRPLSRSKWPVTISGKLSSPHVKPHRGVSRRRSDGADTMPANRRPCVPDIMQLR